SPRGRDHLNAASCLGLETRSEAFETFAIACDQNKIIARCAPSQRCEIGRQGLGKQLSHCTSNRVCPYPPNHLHFLSLATATTCCMKFTYHGVDMEPVSPWHANIGDILSRIFNEGARGRFRVRVQYPINLGQLSQPQPDLVLYRPGMGLVSTRGQRISPLSFRLATPASHLILAKNLPSTGLTGSRSIGSST